MAKKRNKKPIVVKGTYFDYPALFYIIFLSLFGVMMVYSSSSYISNRYYGHSTTYLLRQLAFVAIGFIGLFISSKIRYQVLKKIVPISFFIVLGMLLFVLFAGKSVNGASRWIDLGFISFQPSEIAKIFVVIYMAYVCSDKIDMTRTFRGNIDIFIPVGLIAGAIALENLSTAVIIAIIAVGVWGITTKNKWFWFVIIGGGALLLVLMINLKGYRGDRIAIWRNPEAYEKGYQTMQGLYAIGSGGLFGRGLGQSIQKMGNIPEAQNDMIFSIVCEELGIVGAAGLIIVFILLLWRFKFIAEGAPDRNGYLIVVGVLIHIASQVIINMSVVTNVIPNTGVTLPFISYGGSSLVFLMAEVGLVLAVSRQIVPAGDEQEIDDE